MTKRYWWKYFIYVTTMKFSYNRLLIIKIFSNNNFTMMILVLWRHGNVFDGAGWALSITINNLANFSDITAEFREFKTVSPVSSLKRESTSILHPSSLSFTGCLWNFVFNTNWLFWLSVILRVLFLHICPLFCTFTNHYMFFDHLLKNCSKFPG